MPRGALAWIINGHLRFAWGVNVRESWGAYRNFCGDDAAVRPGVGVVMVFRVDVISCFATPVEQCEGVMDDGDCEDCAVDAM